VPVLHNQCRDAESSGGAEHCTDVMRVGDLIEHGNRGWPFFGQTIEEFLKAWLFKRLDMKHSALMDRPATNKPIEVWRK
jgi:hypothetical protein